MDIFWIGVITLVVIIIGFILAVLVLEVNK